MKRIASASWKVAIVGGFLLLCAFGLLAPKYPEPEKYQGTMEEYAEEFYARVATNGPVDDLPTPPRNKYSTR